MSSSRTNSRVDLAALIGSRICHDLISPIGAIGNGLELLTMSGSKLGPELSLVADSVANANLKIRLYRIAFGQAAEGQGVGRGEIRGILGDLYKGTRLDVDWAVAIDCRRDETKAAVLALMCLESAMPYGGQVHVSRESGDWQVQGSADKFKLDPTIWALLDGEENDGVTPAQVHFALLPQTVAGIGRKLRVARNEKRIELSF